MSFVSVKHSEFNRLPMHIQDAVKKYAADSARYTGNYDTAESLGILLDEETALCSKRTFDRLLEYSASLPTGKFEGKVWKAINRGDGSAWLGEYRLEPDLVKWYPNMIRIIWRRLEVAE